MKRGDLVTVVTQGDYGKPRPALVIQADCFSEHPSVAILPITSMAVDAPLIRITIEPNKQNCLRKTSQIMVDKITTIKRDKVGDVFGCITHSKMLEVERSLSVFVGLG